MFGMVSKNYIWQCQKKFWQKKRVSKSKFHCQKIQRSARSLFRRERENILQKKMRSSGSNSPMFSDLKIFRIRRFPGETKYILGAEVELSSTVSQKKAWSRPPISMEFQVGKGWKWINKRSQCSLRADCTFASWRCWNQRCIIRPSSGLDI